MSEQENEKEAVRTTIVGGRPPGSGRSNATVPRGIEVLVKKAAVDSAFRELLFEQRGEAAAAIELELDPAESAVLNAIPREQLARIVGQTIVPLEQRRVFLGRIAATMLAVVGAYVAGCKPAGIQPDGPEPKGIRPDRPESAPTNVPPLSAAGIQPEPAAARGIQPDRPKSNQTNPPPAVRPLPDTAITQGTRPERP